MNPGQEELIKYIYAIVKRTTQGEMVWSQASPTVFVSERNTPSGSKRILIQKASRKGLNPDFLFQVKSIDKSRGGELAIESSEKPYLRDVFSALYDAAESSIDAQTVRILRELLDD